MARWRHPLLLALAFLSATLYAVPPPRPEQTEWIQKKLESIVIPRLEFRDVGLVGAVEFLRKKAVELDPLRAGVPIYLRMQPAASAPAQPIVTIPGLTASPAPPAASPMDAKTSVSLTNIPLSEALRYIASLAGMKCRVLPDGVHIVPADDPDPLYDREFVLDRDMVQALQRVPTEAADVEQPQAPIADMKAYLVANGVQFPQGAVTALDESKTRLRVRNTVEQFDLIETILGTLRPQPEPPIPGPDVPKVINSPEAEMMLRAQRRAEQLMLGQVSIVNATLREAVDTLKRLGAQYDREAEPAMRGLSMVLKLDAPETALGDIPGMPGLEPLPRAQQPSPQPPNVQRLSYVAQNVSFAKAAEAIAAAAGLEFRYAPYALTFVNKGAPEELFTVEYLVPPDAVKRVPFAALDKPGKEWLTSGGVPVRPTTSVIYQSASRKLLVHNTRKEHQMVREMIEKAWKEYYEAHPPTPAAPATSDDPP